MKVSNFCEQETKSEIKSFQLAGVAKHAPGIGHGRELNACLGETAPGILVYGLTGNSRTASFLSLPAMK